MSARVTAYSANAEDARLTLAVECLDCCIEFGWCEDTRVNNKRLEELAAEHNRCCHNRAETP